MTEETPPPGLVAGKYKLTRLLGRGGMGSVWEGVHATLGNRVACKFIEPEYVGSQDAVSRFENEARAAASLKSKHVVDVYDHGITEDGRPYIVMEYLEGEPLDARLEKRGSLNIQEVAVIVLQVSRALSRAHQNGIVHRDLKPENVFLVWDDEDQTDIAKVVDFGIAKFTEPEASGISSATKTGSILGTPYYMSPEQARGLKNLDARSDNWSLGVIAFEALTGQRPFDGEAVGDLLVKICTSEPPLASSLQPHLPPAIDEWVRKALTRDPDERFQSASELADSLVTVAGLPGRGTLGSAVGGGAMRMSDPGAAPNFAKTEQHASAQLSTSGALTGAALETDIDPAVVPKSKMSPMLLAGIAAFVLAGLGAVFAMSSSDSTDAESPAAEAAATASAPPAEAPAAPPVPTPEPEPEKPVVQEEPSPEPVAAPAPPAPRPVTRPATPRPRPRPVAPRPQPAPAPAPAPAPRPSGGFDLGY